MIVQQTFVCLPRWLFLIALLLNPLPQLGLASDPPFTVSKHPELSVEYARLIYPIIQNRCLDCHSGDHVEAGLDLAAIKSWEQLAIAPETWMKVNEAIRSGQMPPVEAQSLERPEKVLLESWSQRFLQHAAQDLAGDPGPVVLRRLNNAQFNFAIRDLTGVESLTPAHAFPADSGAGEGFTNSGQTQAMSPSLLQKYIDAAKEVADHLVLLPDGIRFSRYTTRRDQTDEQLAKIRELYAKYTMAEGATQVNLQGSCSRPMAAVVCLSNVTFSSFGNIAMKQVQTD